MNWLFNKSSHAQSIPQTTPLQQQRLKQIKSLHQCNQNVVEIRRDYEYTVSFPCGNKTATLRIQLPQQFPSEKPTVTVKPSLKHPWVDDNMKVVGSAELNMFYMHSDLGKVVQHIVKEMKKNPPEFIARSRDEEQATVLYPLPTSSEQNEYTARPPTYASLHKVVSNSNLQQSNETAEIESVMHKIAGLSKEVLEKIIHNPDMLLDYIVEMNSVKELKSQRQELVSTNEVLAKENLSLEPSLDELKGDLKELFEDFNELYYSFQSKARKQDEYAQMYEINNIGTNLRISVLQAEEESENIAESFLQGDTNLDGFLSSFLEKRKECHLMRAKEERLKQI